MEVVVMGKEKFQFETTENPQAGSSPISLAALDRSTRWVRAPLHSARRTVLGFRSLNVLKATPFFLV